MAREDESSNHFCKIFLVTVEERGDDGEKVERYARRRNKKGGPNARALEFRSSEHSSRETAGRSRVGFVSRLFHGLSIGAPRARAATSGFADSPKTQRPSACACIRPVAASFTVLGEMMLSEGMAVPAPCAMCGAPLRLSPKKAPRSLGNRQLSSQPRTATRPHTGSSSKPPTDGDALGSGDPPPGTWSRTRIHPPVILTTTTTTPTRP